MRQSCKLSLKNMNASQQNWNNNHYNNGNCVKYNNNNTK